MAATPAVRPSPTVEPAIGDLEFTVRWVARHANRELVALAGDVEWTGEQEQTPVWVCPGRGHAVQSSLPGDLMSLDVAPDGASVAVFVWNAAPQLWRIDAGTGSASLVFELPREGFAGNERICYSPDGRLLLLRASGGVIMYDPGTDRAVDVPVPETLNPNHLLGASWWPGADRPTLAVAALVSPGQTHLLTLDPDGGVMEDLGGLSLPDPGDVDVGRQIVMDLVLRPAPRSSPA